MKIFAPALLAIGLLGGVASAWADATDRAEPGWSLYHGVTQPPLLLAGDRDSLGLPGLRPRLTMNLSSRDDNPSTRSGSAFSWSLEAWQLNTASLAHIQCSRHSSTVDAFLAEDCRFVDQPVPEDAVNLVQVRGQWTAKPGLQLGVGAFHGSSESLGLAQPFLLNQPPGLSGNGLIGTPLPSLDGLDVNVSFGISTERVGDFLVGLQLARYRQRMSLSDLGFVDGQTLPFDDYSRYANSAQLALGWRRGNFSTDLLGHHYRDTPLWLGGPSTSLASYSSFDLEFSWRPRNASISIGISNILDAAPRGEDDSAIDDPLEQVFGRIPYVRYKHDL